jgi:3-oxoacyl-[acyl-carrier protein] reductase
MTGAAPGVMDLTGRVAVVTGGGRGIGRACALLLARCGAAVGVCDRLAPDLDRVADELAAAGQPALPFHADVRDGAAVEAFVAAVRDRFGAVHVLVNNAGGSFHAAFLDVAAGAEAMLVAENFTQVTRLIRLLVPLMPADSSIVNVTSVEAHQAAPGFAVYAAMKAGLASLTRSLALEFSDRRIRVNAVAPDAIVTSGDGDARAQMLSAGTRYEPVALPPLGKPGTPDDVAAAVLFLASDLSRFITGGTIHVDGGTWAAGGWRLAPAPG